MKRLRKAFAGCFAVLAALCASVNAAAQEYSMVEINGFNCYEIDGSYFTTIDGESYIVINLDECVWHIENTVAYNSSSSSWLNGPEVDISDGTRYNGTLDISSKDDSTPIFIGYTPEGTTFNSRISYNFEAGFVLTNDYSVDVHVFDQIESRWSTTNVTLSFNILGQHKILFTGMTNSAPTKMCLTFLKDGSTGEKQIGYSFYVVNS